MSEGSTMQDKLSALINIATIIGLVAGGYAWVEYRVDNAIAERVSPYESLLAGISLQQNQSNELAIAEFRELVAAIAPEQLDEARLAAIMDPYLKAIAASANPLLYEADFQRLLPLARTKAGRRGDRYSSLGYIYLLSNRPEEAVDAFEDAVAFYAMELKNPEVASTYWGLALCHMAMGQLDQAISLYEKAWDTDPRQYALREILGYQREDRAYADRLGRMYPAFTGIMAGFYQKLSDKYAVDAAPDRRELLRETHGMTDARS